MSFDWQTMIVIGVTMAAAVYTGRSFLGQFKRSDDESEGCAACPAAQATTPPMDSAKPTPRSVASSSDN